jgi:hypothetical protein
MIDDTIDAREYLETRKLQIINQIEKISKNGKPEDNVKLKALQILLNKVIPDKTRHELSVEAESPYQVLLRHLKNE